MARGQYEQQFHPPIKTAYSIYGAPISIENACDRNIGAALEAQLSGVLRPFAIKREIDSAAQTHGLLMPFDLAEVSRSLTRAGESRRHDEPLFDIYSQGETHWILDDRWGVCEIDLLKHRWRSWIIPHPALDAVQLTEAAVVWPMAQLLRLRGIELVPAIAVERAGWGALVIAPYPIPREMSRIIRAGYRIIGQRWTAIVRHNDRIVLRHVPGLTESPADGKKLIRSWPIWTDLIAGNPWASAEVAWCDAVLVIAPGRRSKSCGRVVSSGKAQGVIRRAWPICDLPVDRLRLHHPATTLAEQCTCLSLQLSRHEEEFLELIELARHRAPARAQVTIHKALRRHFVTPMRASA